MLLLLRKSDEIKKTDEIKKPRSKSPLEIWRYIYISNNVFLSPRLLKGYCSRKVKESNKEHILLILFIDKYMIT